MFMPRRPQRSATRDDDMESFSNVSRARSDVSGPITTMDMSSYVNRPMDPSMISFSKVTSMKSNSAIANRSYTDKLALWGITFASLMVACMRRYIQFTQESGHIVDERALMKTYCRIVPELYRRIKSADLPAVQSQNALFMSKVFSRKDEDDVPISTAKTWWEMTQHSDGASCMSVIESVFTAAKMVPEALMYPISGLVRQMNQPVVRNTPKDPALSIPSTTKIVMTPNGIENFCRCLKVESLKTYIRYRLQGENEISMVAKMLQTMRDTDMFDNKNLHRPVGRKEAQKGDFHIYLQPGSRLGMD